MTSRRTHYIISTGANLGGAIAAQRRRLGLTQANLPEAVGVSTSWLSRVENGHAAAEIGLVLRVAKHVGLRITATTVERDASPRAPDSDEAAPPYPNLDTLV